MTSSIRNYKKERTNDLHGSFRNILRLPIDKINQREGLRWYSDAQQVAFNLGKLAGYSTDEKRVQVGAGLLSALSPQTEWGENIHEAHIFLGTGNAPGQTMANNKKAFRIISGEDPMLVLGGDKTRAFYKAISDPFGENTPVIDRHAGAVYMGRPLNEKERRFLSSTKIYNRVASAFVKVADMKGVHPNVLQAQTWLQWREDFCVSRKAPFRMK